MKKTKIDIPFLISISILVITGFLIFSSASLGLLSKQAIKYGNVAFNQTFFGLFLGSVACFFASGIDYKIYRKYSLHIFIASICATILVFIPHIGSAHGGAERWIYIGPFSMQPAEILKIGFIIYLSAWLTKAKDTAKTLSVGFI